MQYELTYIAVFLNDWRISGFVIPCLRANCSTSVVSKRGVWIKSNSEALDFIQTTRFDTTEVEQFARRHGCTKPDMRQSLRNTAIYVSSYCITKGKARRLAPPLRRTS